MHSITSYGPINRRLSFPRVSNLMYLLVGETFSKTWSLIVKWTSYRADWHNSSVGSQLTSSYLKSHQRQMPDNSSCTIPSKENAPPNCRQCLHACSKQILKDLNSLLKLSICLRVECGTEHWLCDHSHLNGSPKMGRESYIYVWYDPQGNSV